MSTRVILDCDPGIDDALAIAFAIGHPGIEFTGITTVAGNVGLGAAKAVQDADNAGGKVNMMWVDTDGCVSAPQYCKYFITSVEKGIVPAVKTAVTNAANGTASGGTYVGTLANGGAVLAPYHDFASKVPSSLQSELNTIKQGIINGSIKVATKSPA